MSSAELYKDKALVVTTSSLKVFWYYFPTGQSKEIELCDIAEAKLKQVRLLKAKSWGMALDFSVWWPLQFGRQIYANYSVIVTKRGTSWPKIGLTPGGGTLEACQDLLRVFQQHCPCLEIESPLLEFDTNLSADSIKPHISTAPTEFYKDNSLVVTSSGLKVFWYYFPTAWSKEIELCDIVEAKLSKVRLWKVKTWGIALDFSVWWPFQIGRELFAKYSVIVTKRNTNWPKIGLTPGGGTLEACQDLLRVLQQRCPLLQEENELDMQESSDPNK